MNALSKDMLLHPGHYTPTQLMQAASEVGGFLSEFKAMEDLIGKNTLSIRRLESVVMVLRQVAKTHAESGE